ncbi:MAG TPA: DUF3313 domain-containing protein [Candidatus Acidoferrum sp.]|jgi:hypothetical protein
MQPASFNSFRAYLRAAPLRFLSSPSASFFSPRLCSRRNHRRSRKSSSPTKQDFFPTTLINPADQARLEDYFTKAIRDELKAGHYNLVTESTPGVMRLRFAITNVEPNGRTTNAAVSGTTAVATHAIAPGAGELVPRLKVGKVSIEGEMVDSASGEVEMAFMTSKSGRRFFSGLKAFQKWGDIDAAFRSWAKNFRQRLDKAHAS